MAWPKSPINALWESVKNGTIQDDIHLHGIVPLHIYGRTMLHIVCKNGNLISAKWLIDQGVDIDSYTIKWETSFNLSCKYGQLRVAKWLHANGANIHFADRYDKSPLFNACMLGHLDLAKWLVSIGADIYAENIKGETPIYIAGYFNHLHVIDWLWSLGVSVRTRYTITELGGNSTLMYIACLRGNLEVVKWVHSKGGGEDMHLKTTCNGNTALHIACVYDNLEVAKWLVAHGADISVRNLHGNTPLMEACRHNNLKIVKWLWWLNPPEISKKTPLTEAFTSTGCGGLVLWLLLNGAVTDSTGNVWPLRLEEIHPNEYLVVHGIAKVLRHRDETLHFLFLAVRSRLGDATSTIFDYLGGIRGRQLRIARQISRIHAPGAADS